MSVAEKKRSELILAMERGEISGPLLSMFARKPPMPQVGVMTGLVQVQNSQQGTFMPEIYGAAPTVTINPGVATTWSSLVNVSTGAGGVITKNAGADQTWSAGAVYATPVGAAADAFLDCIINPGSTTFF